MGHLFDDGDIAGLTQTAYATLPQYNDTFAVYRDIYRITDEGPVYACTTRVVISASDGEMITAHPMTR